MDIYIESEDEFDHDCCKDSSREIPVLTRIRSNLIASYKVPKHPELVRVRTSNIFFTTLAGSLSGTDEIGSQGDVLSQDPFRTQLGNRADCIETFDSEIRLKSDPKQRPSAGHGTRNKITRHPDAPPHCQIPFTGFLVDHFKGDLLPWAKAHFLTHAHESQLKDFDISTLICPVFCSPITARVLKLLYPNLSEHPMICPLPLDKPTKLQEVTVIPIDSNHCPGSVMWLFILKCPKTGAKKVVLHTGHFKATREMESLPVFWNHSVDILYLDAKHSSIDFSSAEETLTLLLDKIRGEVTRRENHEHHRALVVCGAHYLGSEKLFLKLSAVLNSSIWMPKVKRSVLSDIFYDQSDNRKTSYASQKDATLHVLPNRLINHKFLRNYLVELRHTYNSTKWERVLGIRVCSPMDSNVAQIVCSKKDLVTIYNVDYSLHSNRAELIRFLRFLKPSEAVLPLDPCKDDLLFLGSSRVS